MNRLVLIGVLVSAGLIVVLLSLIRARRLQERHAIIWLAAAVVIVVLGVSSGALSALSRALGIAYPPSALFLVVVAFLGLALLDTVITISRLTDRVRSLAQRIAILDEQVRSLKSQVDTDPDDGRAQEQEGGARQSPPPTALID